MLNRRRRDRRDALDAEVWGDVVAEGIRRSQGGRRPSVWTRTVTGVWRARAQAVPVLVIAALFVAGLAIRAAHVPAVPVAVLCGGGLAAWYWLVALGARSTTSSMLRPSLAAAYLVASAALA